MKDLVEMVELAADGRPLDESWEQAEAMERRIRHLVYRRAQALDRRGEAARSRAFDRGLARQPLADERVDRDLVERGVDYLPLWLRWWMGGRDGQQRPRPKSSQHLTGLLARASELLSRREAI
ncbi:hypothetical protein N9917_00360 [Deltaproteobacteria bacterium]|nr:hypothetical protein [Deltaproteobacteria bacterium]